MKKELGTENLKAELAKITSQSKRAIAKAAGLTHADGTPLSNADADALSLDELKTLAETTINKRITDANSSTDEKTKADLIKLRTENAALIDQLADEKKATETKIAEIVATKDAELVKKDARLVIEGIEAKTEWADPRWKDPMFKPAYVDNFQKTLVDSFIIKPDGTMFDKDGSSPAILEIDGEKKSYATVKAAWDKFTTKYTKVSGEGGNGEQKQAEQKQKTPTENLPFMLRKQQEENERLLQAEPK